MLFSISTIGKEKGKALIGSKKFRNILQLSKQTINTHTDYYVPGSVLK